MVKFANTLFYALLATACLGAGLWFGPGMRGAWERMFPEPAYVSGDFSALYRETGKPVVLFSTSTCPYCQRTREFLAHEHIDYQDFLVDQSADARQRFSVLQGGPVPLLLIGDRRIVGFREDTIRESLASIRQSTEAATRMPGK